jgi:tetratricopeptide (TPR) repeat protein
MKIRKYDLRKTIKDLPVWHRLAGLMICVVYLILTSVLIVSDSEVVQICVVGAISGVTIVFMIMFFKTLPHFQPTPPTVDRRIPDEEDFPQDILVLYYDGVKYRNEGHFWKALTVFQEVSIKTDGKHWKARFNVGTCYMKMGLFEKALGEYDKLINDLNSIANRSTEQDNLVGYSKINKALILSRQDKIDESYKEDLEANKILKDDTLSNFRLFIASYQNGNYSEAKKYYDRSNKKEFHFLMESSLEEDTKDDIHNKGLV